MRLQATEHTIVPLHMDNMGEGLAKQRFQLHHTLPNSKKVYLRGFGKHLDNMLDDSGYKFSEEYEVRGGGSAV